MRAELGFNRLDMRLWLNPTIDCDIHIHYHDLNWNAEMSSEMQVQWCYLIIRTGLYCRYLHTPFHYSTSDISHPPPPPPPTVIQLTTIKSQISRNTTLLFNTHLLSLSLCLTPYLLSVLSNSFEAWNCCLSVLREISNVPLETDGAETYRLVGREK